MHEKNISVITRRDFLRRAACAARPAPLSAPPR